MLQACKRKTNRGCDGDMLQHAMQLVVNEESVRHTAQTLNMDYMTLKRFIDKQKDDSQVLMGKKTENV